MSDQSRLWLITGASRGLGRAQAEVALQEGDSAILSVRDPASVADLVSAYPNQTHVITLDLTQSAGIAPAIADAERRFGAIDILMNNAGYVVVGTVEEVDAAMYRRIFETNFFGALEVMRAVIPSMRKRRSGYIFTMSAMGGFVSSPGLTYYCSTKAALDSITEGLAQELQPFGVKVTIVQPGNFRTSVLDARIEAPAIDDYKNTPAGALRRRFSGSSGIQPGDPVRAAKAVFAVSREEKPPLRLPLGSDAVERIVAQLDRIRTEIDRTAPIAATTAFDT